MTLPDLSESTWIALFAIISTVLVAGIGGLVTICNTSRQLHARRDELREGLTAQHDLALLQAKHQEREARRTNLIEARKTYLMPLRDRFIPWAGILISHGSAIAQLQLAVQESVQDLTQFAETVATWQRARDAAATEFANYTGQVSDSSLRHLLNDFWAAETTFSSELSSLLQEAYQLGTTLPDPDTATDAFQRWQSMFLRTHTEREERLLVISKRIEELLAGDQIN